MAERKPTLIIPDKPQILVRQNDFGGVVITVSGISEDFQHVEINDVVIPLEYARAVAGALIDLIDTEL